METEKKQMSYSAYKERVIKDLVENRTWDKDGVWRRNGEEKDLPHILPYTYSKGNTEKDKRKNREERANAIKKYMKLDCRKWLGKNLTGLHQFAHHANSSQILCMKFFSEMMDENHRATQHMVDFIKDAFGIYIHVGVFVIFLSFTKSIFSELCLKEDFDLLIADMEIK